MKYMFVVAHPDDEVLGAGGFIHKLMKNETNDVMVIIMNALYEKTRNNMYEDIEKSHNVLGIRKRKLLGYANMEFHIADQRKMVEDIEKAMKEFKPDYIFTHFDKDIHNDHRITSIATQQASRLWQRHSNGHKTKGLYFMEVPSSTNWSINEFKPDTYIELDKDDIDAKIESLKCYENVVRETPHPRSEEYLRALPIIRGGEIGYKNAEAFITCWRDNI